MPIIYDSINYPNEAYELVHSLSPKDQQKILNIIKEAIGLKE